MTRTRAVLIGSIIAVGSTVILSICAALAAIGVLMAMEARTPWSCLPLLAGAFLLALAALLVPLRGVSYATRNADWRAGYGVVAITEVVLAVMPALIPLRLPPQSYFASMGIAAVFGVLGALTCAHASRSFAVPDACGPGCRTVYVNALRQGGSGSGVSATAVAAGLFFVRPDVVIGLFFAAIAGVVSLLMKLVAVAGIGGLVGLSVAIQVGIALRLAADAWGGLGVGDLSDLSAIGRQRGTAIEHGRIALVWLVQSALVLAIIALLCAAVLLARYQSLELASGPAVLAIMAGAGFVRGLVRRESIDDAPVEWMRRLTGATWAPRGEHTQVKKVLGQVSSALGLPYAPGLLVVDTNDVNAWVVGDPDQAAIGVTRGLLEVMGRDELRGAFASLVARVVCGGVRSPALEAVYGLRLKSASPVGHDLAYMQACDIRGALAILDVDLMERALTAALGHGTRIPGMDHVFAAHMWLWPHDSDEVPQSELHRIELLRAVDPGRTTLRPERHPRPHIAVGVSGEAHAAWVICSSCGRENGVQLDRCVACTASLG